jgi:integrase
MASIHKQDGRPNWFCAFYDPEGFRRFRSTGTDNARIARTLCVNMERAATLARQGKLSNEKALKVIRETCAAIEDGHGKLQADRAHDVLKASVEEFVKLAGGELQTYTVRSWLESWIKSRTDASKATILEYERSIVLFLRFLGARADKPLSTLQQKQIEDFKASMAARVAPSTVNKALKMVKASFGRAVASRQLEFNPAEFVSYMEEAESRRRPFTQDEIGKLLKAADSEWRTMILIGFYCGQRLRDCANLTWESVDLLNATIELTTMKTGRRQDIPIAEPLARHLSALAGDKPDAPLCPSLYGKQSCWLSAQFYNVMVKAGLVPERDHQTKGTRRDGKREKNRISFHSLRFNTTSALKNAGVNDSVTMDIVGHETTAVSRSYTKIDTAAKRAAIAKLPDVTKGIL